MENSDNKTISSEQYLTVVKSCLYGLDNGDSSNAYDTLTEIGDDILYYRLSKIKCQLKSNKEIIGVQFIYINRNDNKESALIDVQPYDKYDFEQTFELEPIENIVDVRVWLTDKLVGFEVVTNTNKIKIFGYQEGDAININGLEEHENFVIGFGIKADKKIGVTGIYVYYLDSKTYNIVVYSGIFYLRLRLKNKEFREKILKKLDNLEENLKILYRVCTLPDNLFFNIAKHALS